MHSASTRLSDGGDEHTTAVYVLRADPSLGRYVTLDRRGGETGPKVRQEMDRLHRGVFEGPHGRGSRK